MFGDIPIIGGASQPQPTIEVCRSFAYKLNLANHGGPQYESADFFASRKLMCAAADADWVSQQLFEECVAEVRASVKLFVDEMQARAKARRERTA
jgi:hypothetical protein